MTTQPVTMYRAVCDRCGAADEGGEYFAWQTPEDAEAAAADYGEWKRLDEGDLVCFDCYCKSAAEDEDDG